MALVNGYDPIARRAQLEAEFAPNANGGPFDTGLAKNDFAGYVQRMKDQQELAGLQSGKPLSIEALGSKVDPYAVSPATGQNEGDLFGQAAGVGGSEWEAAKKKAKSDATLASMHSLMGGS